MLEIEKKEIKKLKTYQKLLEWMNQSPWYNQGRYIQSRRGNVYKKTDQEPGISETGTILKLSFLRG